MVLVRMNARRCTDGHSKQDPKFKLILFQIIACQPRLNSISGCDPEDMKMYFSTLSEVPIDRFRNKDNAVNLFYHP